VSTRTPVGPTDTRSAPDAARAEAWCCFDWYGLLLGVADEEAARPVGDVGEISDGGHEGSAGGSVADANGGGAAGAHAAATAASVSAFGASAKCGPNMAACGDAWAMRYLAEDVSNDA